MKGRLTAEGVTTAVCVVKDKAKYLSHNDITVQTSVESLRVSLHPHLERNKS